MRFFPLVYRILAVLLLVVGSRGAAQSHADDIYWDDQFGLCGVSGGIPNGANPPHTRVQALAVYGDIVFAGGDFTLPGNFVAAWNTASNQWSTLGEGVNGIVYDACVVGDNLYIGGEFTRAGQIEARGIACWNISTRTWQAVGGGVQGTVRCLEYDGTYLYAAGDFPIAGLVGANNIARWSGVAWEPLGSGGENGIRWSYINDLEIYQGNLYVALTYGFAGSDPNNRDLVQWNGSSWSGVGRFSPMYDNGAGLAIEALAVYNGTLIVGGTFDSVETTPAAGLVQWDGAQWKSLDPINGTVKSLCVDGDNLYVGGLFDKVDQILANNIAIRNMATGKWSTAGSGAVSPLYSFGVLAIAHLGGAIYAGGNFQVAGSQTVNYIGCWKPQAKAWEPLANQVSAGMSGMRGGVYAFALHNGQLATAGDFLLAGDVSANGVAFWNGQQWSVASGGLSNPLTGGLRSAVSFGGDLYVCGDFSGIGGSSASYLARYDGAAWHELGTPGGSRATNKWPAPWPEMYTVHHDGSRLYAGGEFTLIGAASANCIAEWDGQQWRSLGSGVQNKDMYVYAIATDNAGTLYAGGNFDVMGGVTTGGIARWNGSAWSNLGGTLNGTVLALATDGTDLYVAGQFTHVGGVFVNNIARWDGASWHGLNGGTESSGGVVRSLALHNGKLYAGGQFKTMGGIVTQNIAVWDIQSGQWEPLGSGVDNTVRALAVYNGDLYAGGVFQRAGGKPSSAIARWTKQAVTAVDENHHTSASGFRSYPNPASETTMMSFATDRTGPVLIVLQDMVGREVMRLADGVFAAGQHTIPCSVGSLTSGVYTAVLARGGIYQTLRMVVVR